VHEVRVRDAGLHTVSFAWKLDDPDLWDELARKHRSGPLPTRGEHMRVIVAPIAGIRWMYHRQHRLVACEGPLSTMLGHPDGLEPSSKLPEAAWSVALQFREAVEAFPIGAVASVRRLDRSVDFDMPTALARSAIRRVKQADARRSGDARAYDDDAGTASASLELSHSRRLVAYDRRRSKGASTGSLTTLRLELQERPEKRAQKTAEALAVSSAGAAYARHLAGRFDDSPPLLEITDAMALLIQAGAQGAVEPAVASRLAGDAFAVEHLGRERWPCSRTARRGLQQLRDNGLRITETGKRLFCRPGPALLLEELVAEAASALQ
jgi:hypothetical protein